MSAAEKNFAGLNVLVTGACGTVGAELVAQLVEQNAKRVVAIDNNESELFFLEQLYGPETGVEPYLADIRDADTLAKHFHKIDVVLHAAALKHVGLCEKSPSQAVRTNIAGTENIINAAIEANVQRVIFTSSDKAVNPTNVMGTTKLMGERLMTAAHFNCLNRENSPIFASTRFGNVLGSRGSVVPLFKRQIEAGGPITLTDPEMTRFIMTLKDAAALVLRNVWLAIGGEVFVTKMPIARIEDLAVGMRDQLANEPEKITIKTIGSKPGEKMYEELMNDEEVRRAYDYGDYIVVTPALATNGVDDYPYLTGRSRLDNPYNSSVESPLSAADLMDYLNRNNVV